MTKKQVVYSLFFYFISAFGISLTVKAAVGVSSFNSLNVVLGTLFAIKLGTITTIINLLFLLACYLLDNNKHIKDYLLMLVALLSFGEVINLILYYLLPHLIVENYFLRVVLFISGTLIAGFGTGQVLKLDLLKFPIENFCACFLSELLDHLVIIAIPLILSVSLPHYCFQHFLTYQSLFVKGHLSACFYYLQQLAGRKSGSLL